MIFNIQGEPLPQKRPRFSMKAGRVFVYDEQKEEKNLIKLQLKSQMKEKLLSEDSKIYRKASLLTFGDRFHVDIGFYLPLPKKCTTARENAIDWNLQGPNFKPDLDNLIKLILDCGNGIIWNDDSKITSISARKKYSNNPRTELLVTRIMNNVHEDAERILCAIPKDKAYEIVSLISEIALWYSSEDELNHLAALMSQLSEFHQDLEKVNKKSNKYHLEYLNEKNEEKNCLPPQE